VYQVAVRKQWPGTLVVVVTEHSPVAVWNSDFLLNKKGEVFQAPLAQLKTKLPQLAGPTGSEQDALTMFHQLQSLLALHQFEASRLAVSPRFSWQLTLSNGIELKLGREDTLKRVQRFIDLYPSISKHKTEAIEQVDLRYDTGVAVRFAPAPVQPEKRKA
jgi:cell division protein FtsQ